MDDKNRLKKFLDCGSYRPALWVKIPAAGMAVTLFTSNLVAHESKPALPSQDHIEITSSTSAASIITPMMRFTR